MWKPFTALRILCRLNKGWLILKKGKSTLCILSHLSSKVGPEYLTQDAPNGERGLPLLRLFSGLGFGHFDP